MGRIRTRSPRAGRRCPANRTTTRGRSPAGTGGSPECGNRWMSSWEVRGREGSGRRGGQRREDGAVSAEDLEKYETEMELTLYKEYRDIVAQFSYVVETERRFYLANSVDVAARNADGEIYFEVRMSDAWGWDMYRPARFVKN